MAEIIRFPQKISPRDEALRRLAHKLAAYLTVSFMERNILDVPVQAFIADMLKNLETDGFTYDALVLDQMAEDIEVMKRIEGMFLRALVDRGHITADRLLPNS